MQKIATFLWYDTQAEEAANFYVSLFPNSRVTNVQRSGDTAFIVNFELDGVEYIALNAGPQFTFNEAVSLFVRCESQDEVDRYWDALTANGGEESMCGWLKDRWGLSWQIVPNALGEYLGDPDPEKAGRAMQAMLQMRKIDIAGLKCAHAGQ
jgi:predicted 3-demethylubiquinone-9 3-methyltransferase (glyoxalase superfamily)